MRRVFFCTLFVVFLAILWKLSTKTSQNRIFSLPKLSGSFRDISLFKYNIKSPKPGFRLYNPSLFTINGGLYTVHRMCNYTNCMPNNPPKNIYNYTLIEAPNGNISIIDMPVYTDPTTISFGLEDCRSIMFRNKLYLICNDPSRLGFSKMKIVVIDPYTNNFDSSKEIKHERVISLKYDSGKDRCEKNWSPFVKGNELYLIYQVYPHTILKCDTESGICTKESQTDHKYPRTIRGGSPAKLWNNSYITFGHNCYSINRKKYYTTVVYTFNKNYPYDITSMSDEFLFEDYNKDHQVIQFVSGLEIIDDNFYISYGVQDCAPRIMIIPGKNIQTLLSKNRKRLNPIDHSPIVWEDSIYTKANWPGLDYDVGEKRAIFKLAKNLPKGMGVIDVGAHIGDLAISLAKALTNIGRTDVIVYAIDPSGVKCDFMRKMISANNLTNVRVINTGLSSSEKTLGHNFAGNDNNTGGTRWSEGDGKESISFLPADALMERGLLGPIGLYHIDVEGFEVDALRGSKNLLQKYKPIILLESWVADNWDDKKDRDGKCKDEKGCPKIFKTIREIGYKLSDFLPNSDMILVPQN